ncbi:TPA: hypothetical protein ACH1LS_001393 [Morganella morganii]
MHILKRRSGTIYLTDTGLFIARRINKGEVPNIVVGADYDGKMIMDMRSQQ